LDRQYALLRSSLILNPTENFPFAEDIAVTAGPLHGLYNSDKVRSRDQRLAADILFGGRDDLSRDCRAAYTAWAGALRAADATLRPLSGLSSHIVLFMSATRHGQTVLLLPERAGGHLAARSIVERLGLRVVDMVVDDETMGIDMAQTLDLCATSPPDIVFVDRSEGLVVEDLSPLTGVGAISIFDASQYLSQVLTGDHPDPFKQGYDLIVSSLHKNFPGPQKALIATRERTETWEAILRGVSTFVSNMHVASIYAAALTLRRSAWLETYSKRMLVCAVLLEEELSQLAVPVVRRPPGQTPTHHLWIREGDRLKALTTFERLEQCGIITNYRILPYTLGPGLRLGLSAATRVGLVEADVPRLAELIATIRRQGATKALREETRAFNKSIWQRFAE